MAKLSVTLIEELIDAWNAGACMNSVLARTRQDFESLETGEFFDVVHRVLGVSTVRPEQSVRDFVQTNKRFLSLSYALWDQRPRETCRAIGLRCARLYNTRGAGLGFVKKARQDDKRHDWATVK